ncbi:MAG TPA: hypothetical protein VFN67_41975 [Polyangiales bacterium]|jgi:hypothetical protein|nr:hypothetical protein [Polyangiales bacterium]
MLTAPAEAVMITVFTWDRCVKARRIPKWGFGASRKQQRQRAENANEPPTTHVFFLD